MDFKTYYHGPGEAVLPEEVVRFVTDSIGKLKFTFAHGCSTKLREKILCSLRTQGWSDKVRLSAGSKITITAMRGNIALCLQTGNMSRFYADLLKLQYLFQNGKVAAAIYIVPTKRRAKEMGSNLAHFERFIEELELFREIIAVPTLVIGLD